MAGVDVASTVPVREFEVMTRVADEHVGDLEYQRPGLIVESLLGRFVLDRDGRDVWFRIDGRRTGDEIAGAVAEATGRSVTAVRAQVMSYLERLDDLGLIRAG